MHPAPNRISNNSLLQTQNLYTQINFLKYKSRLQYIIEVKHLVPVIIANFYAISKSMPGPQDRNWQNVYAHKFSAR